MADVRIELDDALASVGAGDASPAQPASTKLQPLELAAIAVIALGAIVNGVFMYRYVPILFGMYAAFAMRLSLPLRLYIGLCNWTAVVAPALLVVWGGFALAGRGLAPAIRRVVLVSLAAFGVIATLSGLYFITEEGVLQATLLSLGWRGQVLERDLTMLNLAAGEPAKIITLLEPKVVGVDKGQINWETAGQAFQLAEAYRALGNVEAARRTYKRAQAAALVFDEGLSQQLLMEQDFWQSRLGVNFAAVPARGRSGPDDWGLPIAELRRLPDLIRTVSQQRLDQLARDEAAKR
jgi:hypothetical protein